MASVLDSTSLSVFKHLHVFNSVHQMGKSTEERLKYTGVGGDN